MDISFLTKDDIERIKRWLLLPNKDILAWQDKIKTCPFILFKYKKCLDKTKCMLIFPRLPSDKMGKYCPCYFYSLYYVIKRARYFVRLWEDEHA